MCIGGAGPGGIGVKRPSAGWIQALGDHAAGQALGVGTAAVGADQAGVVGGGFGGHDQRLPKR